MNTTSVYIIFALISYMFGAIPFGLIIAKLKGVDIRQVGSGNIGATNVFRSVGKGWGILTFICDMLKGFAAARAFPVITAKLTQHESPESIGIIFAVLAIVGHNWPVYLKFKGGKGIATTAGALAGIAPTALGIGLLTWLIVFPLTRYVSAASITAAAVTPIAGWLLYSENDTITPIVLTILGALGILRHKSNIQRLIKGTEHQFEFKKKKDIN